MDLLTNSSWWKVGTFTDMDFHLVIADMCLIPADSCVGGIVQYYQDTECTIYAGTTDLEPSSGNCSLATNANVAGPQGMPVYANLMCTTSDSPRVAVQSAVTE
jgi:hypothetical protein